MTHNLDVFYDLTAALNRAADVEAVQEVLLTVLTERLHYPHAFIGVRTAADEPLSSWLGRGQAPETQQHYEHVAAWPYHIQLSYIEPLASQPADIRAWVYETFGVTAGVLVPLVWGIQTVGMIVIGCHPPLMIERERLLKGMAQQAAVMIGVMSARLRRAKESAVQEERARIAMDIHDTLSQSLFGMVFTLDGIMGLLPDQPESALPEVERVMHTAEAMRQDIRHLINDLWPHELTDLQFEQDLRRYAQDVLQAMELPLTFDIRGEFSMLSPAVRRSLYRICQESLTNIVHHAAATEARVCLDVYDGRAVLAVRDNGRGFEPAIALTRNHESEHFGLHGIYERTRSLGGTCDIFSKPGEGSSLIIDLPIRGVQQT